MSIIQDFYTQITNHYDSLSSTEQIVIDFVMKYGDIEHLKLKDIEDELFVSSTTIIRASKKLGYQSFTQLKYALIQTKNSELSADPPPGVSGYKEIIERVTHDFSKTIQLLSEQKVTAFAEEVRQARRIFCIGSGSSVGVISDFNRRLKLLDLWSNDYYEFYAIERIPDIATSEDVIVVFSLGGKSQAINQILLKAKTSGTRIISITSMSVNPLSKISDVNLFTYLSPSPRKKIRSRLMLSVAADVVFEHLLLSLRH
ncbi:MurR/RpiR family transcriptional regulator [Sporolactobacillus nakayamae]|nr:MurR/RpiR family transcriptional regulator [Sporolactobacillus nakayamae]